VKDVQKIRPFPFAVFPEQRLSKDYPWQIWAVGWIAILKALLWLATEPVLPEIILKITFYKYLLFMIPLIICGIGVWNMRRRAILGIIIVCVAELIFFILYPASLHSMALDDTSLLSLLFTAGAFIINGFISDIFILICAPIMLKHSKSSL
jgi:hypothetical protein